MEILSRQRGGGHIVAVRRSSAALEGPEALEGRRVEGGGHAGGIHDENPSLRHDGRGQDRVGHGNGGQKPERFRHVLVGGVSGTPGIPLGLGPARPGRRLLEAREGERDSDCESDQGRPPPMNQRAGRGAYSTQRVTTFLPVLSSQAGPFSAPKSCDSRWAPASSVQSKVTRVESRPVVLYTT